MCVTVWSSVVTETRLYRGWSQLPPGAGMTAARRALCSLHTRLAREGYTEVFVDQVSRDLVAVTRHCPATRHSMVMVAHTQFHPGKEDPIQPAAPALKLAGELGTTLLEAALQPREETLPALSDDTHVTGLGGWGCSVVEGGGGDLVETLPAPPGQTRLSLARLRPGAVLAVELIPTENQQNALAGLAAPDLPGLAAAVGSLDLMELQFALFQSDGEGREDGSGCYSVPGWRSLHYCGLAGLAPALEEVRDSGLGHPLAANLRSGDWLLDYTVSRLESRTATATLAVWLASQFDLLRRLPRHLLSHYTHRVVQLAYSALLDRAGQLMPAWIQSDLTRRLALGSVIHTAAVASAPLPRLSEDLVPAPPPAPPTLAAGVPHFAMGYMRSWGRDTFISLRGSLLLVGRAVEARHLLLGYAATLRHGLIPNLLDGGKPRYNCRDAVWWWLSALLDYTELVESGTDILSAPVTRLFPQPDCSPYETLGDTVQEALATHLAGLEFVEEGAGPGIDAHMSEAGFRVRLGVDPSTGFVFGGSQHNCGTWMDKMGSSEAAGNRGVPSTPRDGSAVELVGLSYRALTGLAKLGPALYPHQQVQL